jgi:hypothetical protein
MMCATRQQPETNLVLREVAVQFGGLEPGQTKDDLEPMGFLLGSEEDQHSLLERTRAER